MRRVEGRASRGGTSRLPLETGVEGNALTPRLFRPERFADTEDRPRFAYFPFGGGPRRCIGQQFAMLEGKLLIAALAQRYRLELVSDPDIDLSVSITTRPLDPIEMRLEPRSG